MVRGPRASSANLEPLGKRRVFGSQVKSPKAIDDTSTASDHGGMKGDASTAADIPAAQSDHCAQVAQSEASTGSIEPQHKTDTDSPSKDTTSCKSPIQLPSPPSTMSQMEDSKSHRPQADKTCPTPGKRTAKDDVKDEPPRKRSCMNGPNFHASDANLEPLGKQRKGFGTTEAFATVEEQLVSEDGSRKRKRSSSPDHKHKGSDQNTSHQDGRSQKDDRPRNHTLARDRLWADSKDRKGSLVRETSYVHNTSNQGRRNVTRADRRTAAIDNREGHQSTRNEDYRGKDHIVGAQDIHRNYRNESRREGLPAEAHQDYEEKGHVVGAQNIHSNYRNESHLEKLPAEAHRYPRGQSTRNEDYRKKGDIEGVKGINRNHRIESHRERLPAEAHRYPRDQSTRNEDYRKKRRIEGIQGIDRNRQDESHRERLPAEAHRHPRGRSTRNEDYRKKGRIEGVQDIDRNRQNESHREKLPAEAHRHPRDRSTLGWTTAIDNREGHQSTRNEDYRENAEIVGVQDVRRNHQSESHRERLPAEAHRHPRDRSTRDEDCREKGRIEGRIEGVQDIDRSHQNESHRERLPAEAHRHPRDRSTSARTFYKDEYGNRHQHRDRGVEYRHRDERASYPRDRNERPQRDGRGSHGQYRDSRQSYDRAPPVSGGSHGSDRRHRSRSPYAYRQPQDRSGYVDRTPNRAAEDLGGHRNRPSNRLRR